MKLGAVGLDPLDPLHGHWVPLGCHHRCVSSLPCPSPGCAVVPRAWAFGVSALQTPVMLVEAGRCGRGGFAAALGVFASSVGVNRQSWGKEEEKGSDLLHSPLPSPLAASISLRLCIGLRRMELGNTAT